MQKSIPVWWHGEVVDFASPEEAEKIVKQTDAVQRIRYIGKDHVEREGLLVTTPKPQWRTIRG